MQSNSCIYTRHTGLVKGLDGKHEETERQVQHKAGNIKTEHGTFIMPDHCSLASEDIRSDEFQAFAKQTIRDNLRRLW